MRAHAHRWRGLSIGGAVLFVGLGVIALPGPTRNQGIVSLAGGAALIAGGLWMMGGL